MIDIESSGMYKGRHEFDVLCAWPEEWQHSWLVWCHCYGQTKLKQSVIKARAQAGTVTKCKEGKKYTHWLAAQL